MTYEQFKTCLRAYFPGVVISELTKTVTFLTRDIPVNCGASLPLYALKDEFGLPYDAFPIHNFHLAGFLVIGWNSSTPDDNEGYADYSYTFSGNPKALNGERNLLRLLKLIHDCTGFYDIRGLV